MLFGASRLFLLLVGVWRLFSLTEVVLVQQELVSEELQIQS